MLIALVQKAREKSINTWVRENEDVRRSFGIPSYWAILKTIIKLKMLNLLNCILCVTELLFFSLLSNSSRNLIILVPNEQIKAQGMCVFET